MAFALYGNGFALQHAIKAFVKLLSQVHGPSFNIRNPDGYKGSEFCFLSEQNLKHSINLLLTDGEKVYPSS